MKRLFVAGAIAALAISMCLPAVATAATMQTTRVVPLGWTIHHGTIVQGFMFVHGRAPAASVHPAKPSRTDPLLYTFLASGAKWKTVEPFVVNGANGHGVAAQSVLDSMNAGISAWESAAGKDVIGSGSLTSDTLVADYGAPDDVNEVYFGSLDQGTVAVTVVWGVFSGPPRSRYLMEWDMVFNDSLQEAWANVDPAVPTSEWDVLDIATHELGHSCGLGDLYQTAATEQTMYGYASPGETKKRTLESGDIAGIKALYK